MENKIINWWIKLSIPTLLIGIGFIEFYRNNYIGTIIGIFIVVIGLFGLILASKK